MTPYSYSRMSSRQRMLAGLGCLLPSRNSVDVKQNGATVATVNVPDQAPLPSVQDLQDANSVSPPGMFKDAVAVSLTAPTVSSGLNPRPGQPTLTASQDSLYVPSRPGVSYTKPSKEPGSNIRESVPGVANAPIAPMAKSMGVGIDQGAQAAVQERAAQAAAAAASRTFTRSPISRAVGFPPNVAGTVNPVNLAPGARLNGFGSNGLGFLSDGELNPADPINALNTAIYQAQEAAARSNPVSSPVVAGGLVSNADRIRALAMGGNVRGTPLTAKPAAAIQADIRTPIDNTVVGASAQEMDSPSFLTPTNIALGIGGLLAVSGLAYYAFKK